MFIIFPAVASVEFEFMNIYSMLQKSVEIVNNLDRNDFIWLGNKSGGRHLCMNFAIYKDRENNFQM